MEEFTKDEFILLADGLVNLLEGEVREKYKNKFTAIYNLVQKLDTERLKLYGE